MFTTLELNAFHNYYIIAGDKQLEVVFFKFCIEQYQMQYKRAL